MSFRISPLWWPLLGTASPIIVPLLIARNRRFKKNRELAAKLNRERIDRAQPLDLPELDFLELTVLVEEKTKQGFLGDAGVSYLFRTDRGSLLFDVGFGPERPALAHNAEKLGIEPDRIDALVISHLHPDHMGGLRASRSKRVTLPEELAIPQGRPCFLPAVGKAEGLQCEVVDKAWGLTCGIATTGPLARSLFFFGFTEEQALIAQVKNKGLVIFTGCGHPSIELIVEMAGRLSQEPIYVIGGGLHFPITGGRGNRVGIQFQTILGTGKPPWQRITDDDLSRTILALDECDPHRVLPSAHDSCDHSLTRMERELKAETQILEAGETYRF
ncbi:MBL fold metallo-hydrolase [Candidatus Thiosymbion oneisti]|uniref:MBL fold metallo-hydrolase n=1 Tax=Candidatus Thiosymbion oneisti TaxID=589554 RepID=UPI00105C4156|nr:MBL fold metallo-hydrolase [Candidatus Thiosymbion oneisti]